MRTMFHTLALMALMTLAHTARAADAPAGMPEGLKACGTAQGEDALDGGRFRARGGRVIRLAMVKAPEWWAKGAAYKSWPYAGEARAALDGLVQGQPVTLWCEGQQTNRLGETVAQVRLKDGTWLQQTLVAAGAVMVFPSARRRAGVAALYEAEDAARAARRGLWALTGYQPVMATPGTVKPGWFQIIRGRVVKAARVGDTIYVNFGRDWHKDVTVEIPARALKRFRAQGLDPLTLAGHTVEARGFVDYKSGPRLLVESAGRLRLVGSE